MAPWLAVEALFERGGPVLGVLAVVVFLMWVLLVDRFLDLRREHPQRVAAARAAWRARSEHASWHAEQIRRALVSEATLPLGRGLPVLRALVRLCTLVGLLGTVSGMVVLFDTMAITGSSSARVLADGIARATLPTAAGMIGALSGLWATSWLERNAVRERHLVADRLSDGLGDAT